MVSKSKANAKVRMATITKACVTPKTERGLPVGKRPRNKSTKVSKIEEAKRYCKMNETSRKRCGGINLSLLVPSLKRMLPVASS
jgi:hypothetical protein